MKYLRFLFITLSGLALSCVVRAQDFEPQIEKAMEYYDNAQFNSAAVLFETILPLIEQRLGADDTTFLTQILIYTSVSFQFSGQYEKAEVYFLRTKSIFESINATMDYGYAITLGNLAVLYDDMGKYFEAEILYKETIELDKFIYSENSYEYANDIANLAALYHVMGRYDQAEVLYNKAIEITRILSGEDDLQYALYSNNLAHLYTLEGKYSQAETLYLHSLEIAKKKLGENHPQYAKYLNNLAQLYFQMKLYEKAETLFIQSLEITRFQLGENHPSYALKLNNLASLYKALVRYKDAESLLKQALDIDRRLLSEDHPYCARDLNNLSALYQESGQVDQVDSLNRLAFSILKAQIRKNTGFLSEKELAQFFNTFLYHLDIYQSFNKIQSVENNSTGDFAYDIEVTQKGILLESAIGIKIRILESGDTTMINEYYELRSMRKKIEELKMNSPGDRIEEPDELSIKANELEKTLTLKSRDLQKVQKESEITWENVKQNLKSGEAVIEFSSFHYFNGKESTDSILYCAIVLKSDDTIPQMVYLCEELQIKNAIPSSSGTAFKEINSFYNGQSLYKLIWQPIDSLLTGIKTIYFAPSGLLNSISMAAITSPDNKSLMEKYNLFQLSSTRTLAMHEEPEAIKDAAVYGGIKYDTDTLSMLTKAKKYSEKEDELLAYNRSATWNNRSGFRYLEGTQKEAEQITAKLDKKGITTTTYSGEDAPEESFVALSGNDSPSVIHISTHGFYYPDTISDENRKKMDLSGAGEVRFRYSDDPLLRSGLLMSGANRAWRGLPIPAGVEDGILTAKEVSKMNLMKTELVVLSACQTGQGDVKGSEGVEGLQRGFKMAGVRYIMMSLWEIPDRETTEFMETFYDNWLGDQEIRDAFRNTQLKMKNKYKDEPFKWAGFVLME